MEDLLKSASKNRWKAIGTHKRAGVVAPLFSLYSGRSLGIGELDDLKLLADWCSKTGNSIMQLLPMNEVGPVFCPYDSISSFALEGAYLSLRLVKGLDAKSLKSRLELVKKRFTAGGKGRVDYGIKEAKMRLLWDIYRDMRRSGIKGLDAFIEENAYWVRDFALFKVLKNHHGHRAWYEWEDRYRSRDASSIKEFEALNKEKIDFEIWVQWELYKQFKDVKEYAASKKVLIKGDLPVLVSKDSADVWAHPEFFKLDLAAGAPPDMYCAKGQRWGMPTYEWGRIESDGYRYFKEKLKYAENFYDILRIDHVVGLFRIWSIPFGDPLENKGLNGFFDPEDENEWEGHGRKLLSVIIDSTNMLLCAEDLGVIPKACPKVLKEFGVPGNDVQRWTKDWEVRHDFLMPREYRFISVAMLSTHDTTNWAAWWEHEAGTVDEALFARKCAERGIDYAGAAAKLFDAKLSSHGRLRWLGDVASGDALSAALGKPKEEIKDFIEMYENSFGEKERLWKLLEMKGPMEERSTAALVRQALKMVLDSRAIFCINLITDLLYLTDMFKDDPYRYRINTPGTVRDENWSLVMPVSLEGLLKDKCCRQIRAMAASSKRT